MATVDSGAVGRGAASGLLIIVPLSALRAVLDREVANFDNSGWVPLFALALFLAYVVAGVVAGRRAPDAPLTNGIVAALGALALWLPLRVLIWLVRDESHGLFTGSKPVFTAGQLFAQVLFAAAFGLIGGLIGARMARTETVSGREPSGGPG